VAAIGRRDFIREVIATQGWNQHHNDVYWGFTGNFLYLGAAPLTTALDGYTLHSLADLDGHLIWSCTHNAVGEPVFDKVLLVLSGE